MRQKGVKPNVKSLPIKRLFDVFAASVALVVFSPVLFIVAVLVRVRLGSPVLFRQQRPGLGGKPFELIKFRTMTNATDREGRLRSDEERLTPFGSFLRSTSLDELPELMNVIRGEMSLVGPRPLLMQYLDIYTPDQARRHDMLPGITGLAQVCGRNAQTWDDRLKLDTDYIDDHSFWGDLSIIVRTVSSVIKREGVAAEGHVTMPVFAGTEASPELANSTVSSQG
jgi:sugar transferase EpsL